jgi:16S rRNA (cytidine1402-2'-O)-methyltransferase
VPSGTLYLVPTPIGHLKDITFRAIEVLKNVDLILAEDTRTSGVLLNHYEISTPKRSFHLHNEHAILNSITQQLIEGKNMALISDAGTPGISDPGYLLVREVIKRDVKLEVLPGPTAILPALIKSGFPTDKFVFEGFLPHKKGRNTRLNELKSEKRTIVLYESPHRVIKTLQQFLEVFGDRRISISRELTKKFEETITGTIPDLLEHFTENDPKGEFVIVLDSISKK